MMKYKILYFISLLGFFSCSSNKKFSQNAKSKSKIETIAVLPFEVITTGRVPRNFAPEEVQTIEVAEGLTYQKALASHLAQPNIDTYEKRKIQPIAQTLKLLEANNIGVRKSWKTHPQKLANILGVDAVVKSRIKRKLLKPKKENTAAKNVASQVINQMGILPVPIMPNANGNLQTIQADYVLVRKKDGDIIWRDSYKWKGDKNMPLEPLASQVNQKASLSFMNF